VSPWARFFSAALLVWVFIRVLSPGAAGSGVESAVEERIRSSRDEFAAGRWQAALGPTRALVEQFPTQQVYSDRLARIYFHLGQPVEEAAAWEQFVRSSSTPEDACPAMGQAYLRAGNRDASLHAFERCRDFEPSSAEGWFYLGRAYQREGRQADALQTFRESVRVDPQHADSRVGLAGSLLREGQPRAALEAIEPAIERDPGYADVHLMRGLALLRLGRRGEARTALEHAAGITSTYPDVHLALGMLEYAEGDMSTARQRFTAALTLAPGRRDEVVPWLQRTEERAK
jgi:tetratricopeptide (TPR) repeat protein